MIAILSAVIGFLGSIVPQGFKVYQDSKDKKHELDMMDRQIAAAAQGRSDHLEEVQIGAISAANIAVQESYQNEWQNLPKKYGWVMAYASIVRPTTTFIMLLFYGYCKWCLYHSYLHNPLPWQTAGAAVQAGLALWTPFDEGLLGIIVGFWFGERGFRKRDS